MLTQSGEDEMADIKDDGTTDPVLVRPYITTEPGTAAPSASTQTWPRTAMLPLDEPIEVPGAPGPADPGGPSRSAALAKQRLLVLSGVAVLALGAGGIVLLTAGGDEPSSSAAPTSDFSYAPTSAAAVPGTPGPGKASIGASARSSRSARSSASGRAASPGLKPTGALGVPQQQQPPPQGGAAPTTAPAGSATATLAPPPGTAITGPVTSAAGRCLALGSLLGLDGSPIQASGCSGVSYQNFTLATDGTLRVAGHCTEATDNGTVRSVGCDDRAGAQWRRGPGGSLVNSAAGLCLTDPGSSGATARVSACTGAADQSWQLSS
ncbi:RICIN domain-containing protein [Actinoplanes sp. N902-109]|uniref:RICIN domain-containing protein n=1 Tax=Actinoplanes sp. (strain N902-109) TaxID=649831 RepID=UPI00032961E4|nr:RICIN domain-containing protein [Actinoplanes sp. N902-109]AGL17874.1 alpha-1,2-mannosidase [Actinoplanes sp. N902-109]